MDFGIIDGNPPEASSSSTAFAAFEPARYAMGDTLRFAERMRLARMEPRGKLSSTGYVLANPGEEYLVLEPNATLNPLTLELVAGRYTLEWFGIANRETKLAGELNVESSGILKLEAPFETSGPAVAYLKRIEG
jgi:hypothetical protein